jgi:hypothetical protein
MKDTEPDNDSSTNSWLQAGTIGAFAGVPTGLFMQVGLVKTLQQRGQPIVAHRHWMAPPGIGFAVARDITYGFITQKQVLNAQKSQTTTASATEDMGLNVALVLLPLVFDTLAVKSVQPGFVLPKITSPLALLHTTCPPEAVLGRLAWCPLYNWVYVKVQTGVGCETRVTELCGLVAGSVCASIVAFPCFTFKTNLLLQQQYVGISGFLQSCKQALTQSSKHLLTGVGPHAVANLGPDVLCMGFGRLVFAQIVAWNLFAAFGPTH